MLSARSKKMWKEIVFNACEWTSKLIMDMLRVCMISSFCDVIIKFFFLEAWAPWQTRTFTNDGFISFPACARHTLSVSVNQLSVACADISANSFQFSHLLWFPPSMLLSSSLLTSPSLVACCVWVSGAHDERVMLLLLMGVSVSLSLSLVPLAFQLFSVVVD